MYRTLNIATFDPQTIFGSADLGKNCWVWQGSFYNNGYGKFGKRGFMAHRIAYELTKEVAPPDMCLDHLSSNRACINPAHLEVVTLVENVLRGRSKHAVNARKTHCLNGHAFSLENTYITPKRGTRACITCQRIRERTHKLKQLTTSQE